MSFVSERQFIIATRETGYRTAASAVAELVDNAQQPAEPPAPAITAVLYKRPIENVFAPGEGVYPGLIVRSPNRQWLMTLQLDGNLVVYAADLRLRWQTGTSVRPRNAAMSEDGEFALYAHDGTKVWSTGTNAPGARLILEDTGRLVVVAPDGSSVWTSDGSDAPARPTMVVP